MMFKRLNKNNAGKQALSLDAMVNYKNLGYQRHRLSDISVQGAFVNMTEPRVLKKYDPVKVAFKLREHGETNIHLLKGRVSDIVRNGAHITFQDIDLQSYSALLQLEEIQNK